MKKITYILLTIIIIFTSCTITKKATQVNDKKIKSIATKKLIKQVKSNYLNYETLKFKATIKINLNNKKHTLKANFRIKHDSIIWIYIAHSTGYPIANLILKQDSVILINKLDKNYFKGNYEYFKNNFDLKLNYHNIQSLLTGEFFVFSDTIDIADVKTKLKTKPDSIYYTFSTLKKHKLNKRIRKYTKNKLNYTLVNQAFTINAITKKLTKVIIENITEKQKISVSYNKFFEKNEQQLPKYININYSNKSDTSEMSLDIKISKVTFNNKLKYNYNIPNSYKPINEK